MKLPRILLLLTAGSLQLAAATTTLAQSKATLPWSLYAGIQLNYLTANKGAILLRARAERGFDADYNQLAGEQLQRTQVLLGYEWLLSERWSGGPLIKLVIDPFETRTLYSGAFLRHSGHIGSIQFRKRALFEHVARNQNQPNAGQIRLRVDFDRTFPVGTLALRPRIAYELQFDLSFQKQDKEAQQDERTVDHGYLRAELGLDLTPRFTIVPYLLKQTTFIVATKQFDADGNVLVPDGPRNLIAPVVGLDLRYTFPGKVADATHALPTFEGYQD